MTSGLVFDVQRFSVHDGPGIRTTVFLQGCPLRCAWCHNPESRSFQSRLLKVESRCMDCGGCHDAAAAGADPSARAEACPTGACRLQGETWTVEAMVEEVLRDRIFFDESGGGVTFSGGEPLCQSEFVGEALANFRTQGIHTALDTCGEADPEVFLEVALKADLVLYDLKHMDPAAHRAWTGVDNGRILSNLRILAQHHPQIWIRVPLVPGVNDDPADLERLARFIEALGSVRRIHLLPYHANGNAKFHRMGEPCRLADLKPPEESQITKASQAFLERPFELHIGG